MLPKVSGINKRPCETVKTGKFDVKGSGVPPVKRARNVACDFPASQVKIENNIEIKNTTSIKNLHEDEIRIIASKLDLKSYIKFRMADEYFKGCLENIEDMHDKYKLGRYTGETKKWLDGLFLFHDLSAEIVEFLNNINIFLDSDKISVNAKIFEGLSPAKEEEMKSISMQVYFMKINCILRKWGARPLISLYNKSDKSVYDMSIRLYIKKNNEVEGACAKEMDKLLSIFEREYRTCELEIKAALVHIADKIRHALYEQPINAINKNELDQIVERYNNLFETASNLKEFLNEKRQKNS